MESQEQLKCSNYYNKRKCAICNKRKIPFQNLLMSSFPLDPDRCRLWVKATGEEDLVQVPIEKLHELKYLCGSHFAPNYFNAKGNRLRKNAVPTLDLRRPALPDHLLEEFPLHVKSYYDKQKSRSLLRMPRNNTNTSIEVKKPILGSKVTQMSSNNTNTSIEVKKSILGSKVTQMSSNDTNTSIEVKKTILGSKVRRMPSFNTNTSIEVKNPILHFKENMRVLPKTLKFGVATASYQIEGAWNAEDKAPSIWDTFCHQQETPIKDGTTGDDTCKSYEFYKRDIAMIKYLGVDFYRFSISWPRLLPNGFSNDISKPGYEYYDNIINELLINKIEPVVTLYHWDLPQNLQDLGGWSNPLIGDWFGDYARVCYMLFGDRVKTWITINEPKQIGLFGYGMKRFAPQLNAHGIGEYLAAKHILLAHAKAWRIYNDDFRHKQKGVCGITIATDFREGVTNSNGDVEAGMDAMDFEVGLYSHPIFTKKGGFPERAIRRILEKSREQGFPRSRLPEFSEAEIEYVKGTSDFYGFNHYSTKFYTRDNYKSGTYPIPSYDDDLGADFTYLDYEKGAVPHCTVIPHGIRKALKWVKDNCNDPPIMITENGYGTLGGLNDLDRISYYKKYINSILDAIEHDRCNVITYTAWSLMDNFEWDSGLSVKFGLFQVDFQDEKRTRTARSSALWYKDLIAMKRLDVEYIPKLKQITF